MTRDNLNQLGKGFNRNRKTGERSLNKDRPIKPQLERVRDTMDFKIPFDMKFEIERESPRVMLDLVFTPPPRTGCCADCECATCEFFDGGITETLYQVLYSYIPGTAHAFRIDGGEITNIEETDPTRGLVTVYAHNSDGIIICYIYNVCLGQASDGTPSPIPGNPPPPTPPPPSPPPPVPPPPSTSGFTLDLEFSGDTIDPRLVPLWSGTDPGDRLDSDSRAAITIAQTTQADGILTMNCTRKPTPSGRAYAGATWSTYGTFSQKYGTWETRLRYDEAKGTWPSWFLLPVGKKGPYPEIDAMESYGDAACLGAGFTENVVHYLGESSPDYAVVPLVDSSGWHVHKFVWTPSRIDFFIDGVNTFSVTNPAHVPQVALYPIFTMGVGANSLSCRIDGTTPNNLTMQIDYLRVSL